jgi:2-keto-4-pentenoate hydratase/2-oxohepta-3-ene-1,7-dioic acid hydratase in catechol pathway
MMPPTQIEMGRDPDREPPFFFMKPADAVVPTSSLRWGWT